MVRFFRANAWILVVIALTAGAFFVLVDPAPPREITLATGAPDGAYHAFGQRLAERLATDGLTVHLQSTKGSVENLDLLRAEGNEVSIALAQSGRTVGGEQEDLSLLASLFYEPVWFFHRASLSLSSMRELNGRRLAIGTEGSGTRAVARLVLEAYGLDEEGAITALDLGGEVAADALLDGAVDGAIFVGAPGAVYLETLLRDPRIRLYSESRMQALQSRFPRLTTLTIGEGQLNLPQNLPDADHGMLASVATLVVNDRFHPGLTPLVLNAARDLLLDGSVLERPGEFPQSRPGDFPLTREAQHFHRYGLPFMMRFLPFWAASLLDRLIILVIPMLALLIPVFRAAPPFYRWRVRRNIFRWYKHLREIDQRIQSGTIAHTVAIDIQRLHDLQDEILRVKVPLYYSDELYDLHLHIDWVIRRLERVQNQASRLERGAS